MPLMRLDQPKKTIFLVTLKNVGGNNQPFSSERQRLSILIIIYLLQNILILFTFLSYILLKPSLKNHTYLLIRLLRNSRPYLPRPSDMFSLEIYIFPHKPYFVLFLTKPKFFDSSIVPG